MHRIDMLHLIITCTGYFELASSVDFHSIEFLMKMFRILLILYKPEACVMHRLSYSQSMPRLVCQDLEF